MTFQSDLFNRSEQREYFVNPDCFGDDVCKFMAGKFNGTGITCEGPFGEDWGWCLRLGFNGRKFLFCTNYYVDGFWLAFIEPDNGLLSNLFGRGKKGVPLELTRKVHEILAGTEGIQDVRWHDEKEFNKGEYATASSQVE